MLFIGEAPGQSEDILGIPFVGKSGQILSFIFHYCNEPFTYLITNTVSCRPQTVVYLSTEAEDLPFESLIEGEDYEIQDYNREPTSQEIEACRPHIDDLVSEFTPHGIVYLGKVATAYNTRLPKLTLQHPAYIARLEYKLQKVRAQAAQIDTFVKSLTH